MEVNNQAIVAHMDNNLSQETVAPMAINLNQAIVAPMVNTKVAIVALVADPSLKVDIKVQVMKLIREVE